MERPKRARVDLTVAQKQEICRYYQKHPSKTIKNLQDHFSSVFNLTIGHSTIGTILKRAEHWNSIEFPDNVRRTPSTKFANMEKELFDWICKSSEAVSESEIKEKASELIKDNRILTKEWNTQRGWITSFKRRFNLVLVPLENRQESDAEPKGYRPGKMPMKRDPLHRVQATPGRKPSRLNLIRPPKTDTSSIIYDAAIENILQDAMDSTDDDPDTGSPLQMPQGSGSPPVSSVDVLPVSINIISTDSVATTSPVKKSQIGQRNVGNRVTTRSTSRPSKLGTVNTNSIIHEAAIENILQNDTGNVPETQQSGHSDPAPSTAADVFPVVFHTTQNTATAPSVTLSNAQKAMATLTSFFEQDPAASREDLEHLRAIDLKLKWLRAKEAIGTLRTYISSEPLRNQDDLQYLNGLEQRL